MKIVDLLIVMHLVMVMHLVLWEYSILIFRIPTVFDIILLELIRFRNSRYSISSCLFSCLALQLSLSFLYSNVEVENS